MGPRFFDRGNNQTISQASQVSEASMGPRFFDRGNLAYFGWRNSLRGASMGPRFFDRGNDMSREKCMRYALSLQWGRGSLTAETNATVVNWVSVTELQWGRGSLTAETMVADHLCGGQRRFNGAAVL